MKHLLRKYEALASEREAEALRASMKRSTPESFRVPKARFMSDARFIFHTPKVCFIVAHLSSLEIKTKTHLERWVLNCAIGTMYLSLREL